MIKMTIVPITLAGAIALAGCAGPNPYQPQAWGGNQAAGTVVGGVAGGLIGSAVGGTGATVVGAALGAILGNQVGYSLDAQAQARAYYAAEAAFDSGRPQRWDDPRGYYGEVVPYDSYRRGPELCRDFTHTMFVNGRREVIRGTACQLADGSWSVVG
ncbi:glycine zipper domain-containing protein [Rhodoligotrophos defluvii]|uniref:glycine zipper domain-containing protein n=1 Tax=Rhodoligotrophos defluvii TaxID=2561934 RepID=UPI0010C9FC19|nr:glycine zipper domain-containing protein [Rhodoligotrophos defluvii]